MHGVHSLRRAIEERLTRVTARTAAQNEDEDLMEFGRRIRARPRLDDRSPEEIIGYDQDGLPT